MACARRRSQRQSSPYRRHSSRRRSRRREPHSHNRGNAERDDGGGCRRAAVVVGARAAPSRRLKLPRPGPRIPRDIPRPPPLNPREIPPERPPKPRPPPPRPPPRATGVTSPWGEACWDLASGRASADGVTASAVSNPPMAAAAIIALVVIGCRSPWGWLSLRRKAGRSKNALTRCGNALRQFQDPGELRQG